MANKPGPKPKPLDDPIAEERRLRRLEQRRASYWRNHEKQSADRREKSAARRAAGYNRYESEKTHYLKYRYGITVEDYERMLAEQDGRCAVCDKPAGDKRLDVDHCHDSGEVRGLLCRKCNVALGLVEDSAETLMALAAYIVSKQDVLGLQRVEE